MKKYLLFISLFISIQIFAQTTERIEIEGEINVPINAEAAGITVYNLNSHQGTVTDENGAFTMEVALNDSLNISAVQYQPFTVIIDEGVMEVQSLEITVREAINELEKVVVRPRGLTGSVQVDIQRVEDPYFSDLAKENMMKVNYPIIRETEVENIAINDPYLKNGIKFVNIFKAIFLNNKEKDAAEKKKEVNIRKMYKDDFFEKYINIDQEHIDEFIGYVKSKELSDQMLQEGNELDLIEYLIQQGEEFKNRG